MKILAIGDFHGTFPKKFERLVNKERVDLVVSIGDYFPFSYRALWFKYCYGKHVDLWEVIGKGRTKKLVLEDLRSGEKAIRELNALPVPVVSVVGNADHLGAKYNDQYSDEMWWPSEWNWYGQDFFSRLIKKYKNIRRFDYSFVRFGTYVFIGARGGTSPGQVKSNSYKKHKKILDGLFRRFRGDKIIFVSHNAPYNTKLDKISMNAGNKAAGKHYGSKLIRRVIDSWQPLVHIGGHIHEGRGLDRLGKTICINIGSVHEGRAAVITLDGKKAKIRLIK